MNLDSAEEWLISALYHVKPQIEDSKVENWSDLKTHSIRYLETEIGCIFRYLDLPVFPFCVIFLYMD